VASHLQQLASSPRHQLTGLLDRLDDEAVFDMGMRSSMRRAIDARVTLGVIAGEYKPLYRGWATDLSLNGLGLLTEHEMPLDAVLTINLESVAGEELLLPIKVCYVMQMMSKTYRVGGTFRFMPDDPGQARLLGE